MPKVKGDRTSLFGIVVSQIQINRDNSNWRTNIYQMRAREKVSKNTYNPKWNDQHKHFVNKKFTGNCACVCVDLFTSKHKRLPTVCTRAHPFVQKCVTMKTLNALFVYCVTTELLDFVYAYACTFSVFTLLFSQGWVKFRTRIASIWDLIIIYIHSFPAITLFYCPEWKCLSCAYNLRS